MAELHTLIQLRKHRVEEKQKILGDLFRQVERFEGKKATLLERLKKEREALDGIEMLETKAYYGRFEGVIRKDIDRIDGELQKLNTRLELAQNEVRDAFADMKRVEIVQRRRDEEEAAEIKSKEDRTMDEIGIETFRRRDD